VGNLTLKAAAKELILITGFLALFGALTLALLFGHSSAKV